MAEERIEPEEQDLDVDTMDAFRYVLHTVKGISPVSVVAELDVLEPGEQD